METGLREKRKHYHFFGVNIVYLLCAILFLTIGAFFQEQHIESGLIVTEYLIILAPVFLFGLLTKVDMKKALRLKKLPLKHIMLIVLMAVVLIPVIFVSNLFVVVVLNHFDKMMLQNIPNASNGSELVMYLFIISLSAGLCEEFFFRGMVLNAYEGYFNRKHAIVLSAILFGLFHYNLQNLAGPIILGIVFGYLVTITDSIWAGVIAHATNNGVAVLMGFVLQSFTPQTMEPALEETQAAMAALKFPYVIPSLLIFLVLAVVCLLIAVRIIRFIQKDYVEIKIDKEFKIGRTKYKVVEMMDKQIGILAERYYDAGDYVAKIKHMSISQFKRYSIREVAITEKKTVDVTDASLKMIPIIISTILYVFIWMRYLLSM